MKEFENKIQEGLVLVDFYASWCGPCKMMSPIIDELKEEITTATIIKVNVDEEQELASKYNIMSIPTLMLFKDGKNIDTKVGFSTKEDLINWIESNQGE